MSDEHIYEMLWDCKFCGTTKLLGKTHRFCPNCGAAQDPNTRYFPSDEEKVAVHDHVYYGVDKICPACNTPNSGNAEFCMQCGAPLTNAARARQLADQVRREGERFESSGPRDLAKERFEEDMARIEAGEREARRRRRRRLIPLVVTAVVVVLIGLVYALTRTQETTVLVTGHSWEHVIAIEEYGPQAEDAWCDSMPGDAYNITRRTEQRDTRQIPDGQVCSVRRIDNGDGTFREVEECETRYREEPVYDERCYYTVDRWTYSRSVRASGDSVNDTLVWPATNITRTGTCHGCEREAGREAHYYVHLRATNGDETYQCELDLAQWQSMRIESVWKIEIAVITRQPRCDTLQPAN